MLLIGTQVAVDAQELTLSDVQNSGCLDSKHARANGRANINEDNRRPTIILTKEGTILTVQLYNYEANCGTTDFEVTPSISGGSNGAPYSVSIQVIPIGDEEDCICPYNISFTIHDLEGTDFFFSCCWFQGLVTLTENKPLVLGDINEVVMAEVNIDGLNYTLENITNTARLIAAKRGYDIKGELNIPSEINYEGQKYRVTSLDEYAFLGCYDLTSVDIPYSVTSIGDAAFMGCSSLTDVYCHAEDVPNTSNSVFTSTPIASATLHVPAGSIDKYKTTSPWSEFGNIVEMTTSKGIMPFVQDGKVWTYEASNFIYDWEETFSLEGDTLISSRKCLKLYYTCQFYHQEHLYKGAMFEEEGKVYFFASGSTTPVLLYDFSYEPGTIIKAGEFELRINETRLVKYHGEYLKVIDYCILGNEHYPFKGIEGIGFLGGGLTCLIDGYTPVNTGGETSLKTCTVKGEVVFDLQDFYTSAQIVTNEPVTFTKDQMATIILPTAPDASKGKYYRLDRVENGQIVFEQEKQPRARVPYIIVPSEDFSIDISSLDLDGLQADTVTVGGVSFIGSYVRKELPALTGGDGGGSLYYDIIDTTPDCGFLSTAETGKEAFRIGALRAYLTVNWDDPYNHHGSKSPEDKLDIVLKDDGTGIEQIQSSKFKIQNDGEEVNGKWSNGKCYDLSGRKWSMINGQCSMPKGIYIQNSRKLVK